MFFSRPLSHAYVGVLVQKELHECVQHIQDPPTLRAHVTAMYKSNVDVDLPRNEMDANVIHEYHRHKVSPLPRLLHGHGVYFQEIICRLHI